MNIKSSCTAICDFASDIKRGQLTDSRTTTMKRSSMRPRTRTEHCSTSSFRAGASECQQIQYYKPTEKENETETETVKETQHIAHFI